MRQFPVWLRASVIGTIVGIIPGAGTNVATFMAYDIEKKLSGDPDSFGNGNVNGVAAPEAANNAVTGGSLVPLLALGVPGNSTSALFLGAIIFCLLLNLLSACIPAWRASRMNITDALNQR